MLLSDKTLKEYKDSLVKPFDQGINEKGVLSSGLSSYGYDIKLSRKELFIITKNPFVDEIDPKNFCQDRLGEFTTLLSDKNGFYFLVPPYTHALGVSVEYIKVPRECTVLVTKKSTYSRSGLSVLVTAAESGWEGYLTIEMFNNTPYKHRVYANEGICQLLFFQGDQVCETSYEDRKGKYQHQTQKVVFPSVK